MLCDCSRLVWRHKHGPHWTLCTIIIRTYTVLRSSADCPGDINMPTSRKSVYTGMIGKAYSFRMTRQCHQETDCDGQKIIDAGISMIGEVCYRSKNYIIVYNYIDFRAKFSIQSYNYRAATRFCTPSSTCYILAVAMYMYISIAVTRACLQQCFGL